MINATLARLRIGLARPLVVRDEASSVIEFAISLPLLCMFLFSFMEMCLAVYSHDLISELACEGTRYAMVRGASCPTTASPTCEVTAAQVNSYVSAITVPNLAGGAISVTTTYPDGNEAVGSLVQVKITYVFAIKMAFVPKSSLTMSSTSEAYIVQ